MTLAPKGVEGSTSIGEGNECPARILSLKGGGLGDLTLIGGENEAFLYKGVETYL